MLSEIRVECWSLGLVPLHRPCSYLRKQAIIKIGSMKKKIFGKFKSLKPIHYFVIFICLVIYAGAVVGIINYRANRVVLPPKLEISSPASGESVTADSIQIQGYASPRAEVRINDVETKADKEGKYTISMPLSLGENTFRVLTAKGKLTSERTVMVTRVKPVPIAKDPIASTPKASKLNNSGPETLWLLEAGSIAAAGAAWGASRKQLKKSFRS